MRENVAQGQPQEGEQVRGSAPNALQDNGNISKRKRRLHVEIQGVATGVQHLPNPAVHGAVHMSASRRTRAAAAAHGVPANHRVRYRGLMQLVLCLIHGRQMHASAGGCDSQLLDYPLLC